MFTKIILAENLAAFQRRRKAEARIEAVVFAVIMSAFVLSAIAIGYFGVGSKVPASMFFGATMACLFGALFWIGKNVKNAQRASGLVCPACNHPLGQLDVLHAALYNTCKHCNAEIYRT